MNFGNIIFMASLIGGEIMCWLEANWRGVVLVMGLAVLILVGILM